MKLIGGLIILFIYFGPLYIGYITLNAFLSRKSKKSLSERTSVCRESKFLAISIILLLLIPGELIYSTLTHVIPSGDYTLNVEYSAVGYEEVYNEVDYEDKGENAFGQSITKTTYYTNVYLSCIDLDCFDNERFYLDYEIEGNRDYDFEIEYNDLSYYLDVSVGEISDETLNYTIEDRIDDISTPSIVEHSVLMLLDVIGIVGFFMAVEIEKKEKAEVNG